MGHSRSSQLVRMHSKYAVEEVILPRLAKIVHGRSYEHSSTSEYVSSPLSPHVRKQGTCSSCASTHRCVIALKYPSLQVRRLKRVPAELQT